MPPLVEGEAGLERFVHDRLDPRVYRGVDHDPPLEEILDSEAARTVLPQLVEDGVDRSGGLRLDRARRLRVGHRLGLQALREVFGDVAVARHQGQDLVAAAQGPRVAGHRKIVPRRLGDSRQQRGLPGILHRVARQRLAEVVLGAGGEAVPAVAQIVEAGGASEDLAFRLLSRSEPSGHLLLEPEGQPHLLQLPKEFVRGRDPHDHGTEPPGQVVAEERRAVLAAPPVPQEVPADELLGERGATLGQTQPESLAVPPPTERAHRHLVEHAGQRSIVHAEVGEEILVLGCQDRLAEDRRHLLVGNDLAVLPGQLDQHRAPCVVDLAGRRELEANEGLEVRNAAPVEVDMMGESARREYER